MHSQYTWIFLLGFLFFGLTNTWAKPAQPETIRKYLEVTHSKETFEQLYQIRKAYYLNLATQRVLYHIQAPRLDPSLLTPEQYQVAEKIAELYLKNDPLFRSPEQPDQVTFKQLQQYVSNESLLYFIEQYQTKTGQALIEKNILKEVYFANHLSQLLTDYLDEQQFMLQIFRNILTYKNPQAIREL
ncbi:hypothetical protein [Acinetobacter gyllenbergii]|uniref:hypothetical protein n=1 Tax=Acinetobacter gyllenbergii TaxID=134534 RepID=UPI000806DF3B|nr:hypothetical protein [Acinetobacter gyllenbergii]OBY74460.1 hypothetical protein NG55_11655 [Acinetobacter gyllenbergii]